VFNFIQPQSEKRSDIKRRWREKFRVRRGDTRRSAGCRYPPS